MKAWKKNSNIKYDRDNKTFLTKIFSNAYSDIQLFFRRAFKSLVVGM